MFIIVVDERTKAGKALLAIAKININTIKVLILRMTKI